jgi:hypothetical protein
MLKETKKKSSEETSQTKTIQTILVKETEIITFSVKPSYELDISISKYLANLNSQRWSRF